MVEAVGVGSSASVDELESVSVEVGEDEEDDDDDDDEAVVLEGSLEELVLELTELLELLDLLAVDLLTVDLLALDDEVLVALGEVVVLVEVGDGVGLAEGEADDFLVAEAEALALLEGPLLEGPLLEDPPELNTTRLA